MADRETVRTELWFAVLLLCTAGLMALNALRESGSLPDDILIGMAVLALPLFFSTVRLILKPGPTFWLIVNLSLLWILLLVLILGCHMLVATQVFGVKLPAPPAPQDKYWIQIGSGVLAGLIWAGFERLTRLRRVTSALVTALVLLVAFYRPGGKPLPVPSDGLALQFIPFFDLGVGLVIAVAVAWLVRGFFRFTSASAGTSPTSHGNRAPSGGSTSGEPGSWTGTHGLPGRTRPGR